MEPKKKQFIEQVPDKEKFKIMKTNSLSVPNMSFKPNDQEYKKPDENENEEDQFTACGTLTRANRFFEGDDGDKYDYLVMMDKPEYNTMVISGIPVINWYFIYTLFLIRTKYKPQGKVQFQVIKKVRTKLVPLTWRLLDSMIRRELLLVVNQSEMDKFMERFYNETGLRVLQDDQLYDKDEVITALTSFTFPIDISDSTQMKHVNNSSFFF